MDRFEESSVETVAKVENCLFRRLHRSLGILWAVGRLRSAHGKVRCMMAIWNSQVSVTVYRSLLFNGELDSEYSILLPVDEKERKF